MATDDELAIEKLIARLTHELTIALSSLDEVTGVLEKIGGYMHSIHQGMIARARTILVTSGKRPNLTPPPWIDRDKRPIPKPNPRARTGDTGNVEIYISSDSRGVGDHEPAMAAWRRKSILLHHLPDDIRYLAIAEVRNIWTTATDEGNAVALIQNYFEDLGCSSHLRSGTSSVEFKLIPRNGSHR